MSENRLKCDLSLDDFDYNLPLDKIAQNPIHTRENSKLLVFNRGEKSLIHTNFDAIEDFLPQNSLLIINSTKVIPARFFMQKETGGHVELLCISPILPSLDPQIAINATKNCTWECIVGGRRVKPNMILELKIKDTNFILKAKILSREENRATVQFFWNDEQKRFAEILDMAGKVPLPPYIKRESEEIDCDRYQTVYAEQSGSVAAPTAGLHFSDNILQKLEEKEIQVKNLVLHVGPGTFVPIADTIENHNMHFEQIVVRKSIIESLAKEYKKKDFFVTATGTTSLRTLETLYWLGVKAIKKNLEFTNDYAVLEQDYAYTVTDDFSPYEAFMALLDIMEEKHLEFIRCNTQLFIFPPYKIRTIKALITNFHLPKSTLLLLVSAFIGIDNREKIYSEALNNNYRFLSYGDTSLLINS